MAPLNNCILYIQAQVVPVLNYVDFVYHVGPHTQRFTSKHVGIGLFWRAKL